MKRNSSAHKAHLPPCNLHKRKQDILNDSTVPPTMIPHRTHRQPYYPFFVSLFTLLLVHYQHTHTATATAIATTTTTFTTALGAAIPLSHLHSISSSITSTSTPILTADQWSRCVYHYDPQTDTLQSHATTISVANVAPITRQVHNAHHPPTHIVNGVVQSDDLDVSPILRTNRARQYTFVFDGKDHHSLITAWGPQLRLRLVHIDHVNVFVNDFELQAQLAQHQQQQNQPAADTSNPNTSNFFNSISERIRHQQTSIPSTDNNANIDVIHDHEAVETDWHYSSTRMTQVNVTEDGNGSSNYETYFDLAIAYDSSFCARHGDSAQRAKQEIQALIDAVYIFFYDIVDLRIVAVFSTCRVPKEDDPFSAPAGLAACAAQPSGKCSTPQLILEKLSTFFIAQSSPVQYDAAYLLSGYDDGTSIAGAAYLRAACVRKFQYGWVEALSPKVDDKMITILTHELGHTLGARHDTSGFMQPKIASQDTKASWFFSPSSMANMRRFIQRISSQNCLVAHVGIAPNGTTTTHFTMAQGPAWQATDMAFGSDSKERVNVSHAYFLYAHRIGSTGYKGKDRNPGKLMYQHGVVYPDAEEDSMFVKEYKRLLWVNVKLTRWYRPIGAAMAVARLDNASPQNDIIIAYVEGALKEGVTTDSKPGSVWLSIGRGLNETGQVTNGWIHRRLPQRINLNKALCIGMASTNLRSASQTDLIIVYVVRYQEVNIALYNVLFDVRADGAVSSMSDTNTIPGSFGETTRDISLSIADIDYDGALDMVIMHMQRDAAANAVWTTVFTVGTRISRNGVIPRTNWHKYRPDVRSNANSVKADGGYVTGGIAVKKLAAWKQVVTAIFEARPYRVNLFNSVELAEGVLEGEDSGGGNREIITGDTMSRCKECFATEQRVKQCEKRLEVCMARGAQYTIETLERRQEGQDEREQLLLDHPLDVEDDFDDRVNKDEREEDGPGSVGLDAGWVDQVRSFFQSKIGTWNMLPGVQSERRRLLAAVQTVEPEEEDPDPNRDPDRNNTGDGNGLWTPDKDTLECEGFRQVYLEQEAAGCTKDIEVEEEVASGTAHILYSEFVTGLSSEYGDDSVNTLYQPVLADFNVTYNVSGGGTSTSYRLPVTVSVYFRSWRHARKSVINAALNRLRQRQDFSSVFQTGKPVITYRLKKKIGSRRVFFVVVRFNIALHFIRRIYGARFDAR